MKPPINKLKPITITNPNFRPGTKTDIREVVFSMMMPGKFNAALGDMICWMAAIKYVAEQYNYVAGHLIVPAWFIEIAANVMRPYPHWRVHPAIPDRLANGFPLKQPMEHPINATGMNLVDLGFLYFTGIVPPPEGSRDYPQLDLSEVELPKAVRDLNYAVMTPGVSDFARSRMMTPEAFNGIADHLNKIGITPVFLGKSDMGKDRTIGINTGYDLTKGLNLMDSTTLLQAAKVIESSRFILGIDNGLLHLAGMTGATIMYGYTVAGPDQRRITRPHGHLVEFYPDKEKLACVFCQERVRFFIDHAFTNCIYKENVPVCVQMLNAETWIHGIDTVLGEQNGTAAADQDRG